MKSTPQQLLASPLTVRPLQLAPDSVHLAQIMLAAVVATCRPIYQRAILWRTFWEVCKGLGRKSFQKLPLNFSELAVVQRTAKGATSTKIARNSQKVARQTSTLVGSFRAGQRTSKFVKKCQKFRDAETTILIKFAFWRGLGRGNFTKIVPKRCFFLGNSMTIKFGNFANFIVRNFVVIWEAPQNNCQHFSIIFARHKLSGPF